MILYHATNQPPELIIDHARMTKAANGLGFYLTDDYNIAKCYGKNVITYDFSEHPELLAKLLVRPLNHEDLSAMEYVVIDHSTLISIILEGLGE